MANSKVSIQFESLPGSPYNKGQTTKIGRAIVKLSNKKAELTFDDIIAEAKKKSSPLHDFYEWNGKTAAINWRRHQTQQMVSFIHIRLDPTRTIPILRSRRSGKSKIWVRVNAAARRSRSATKQKLFAGCQSLDVWIHMYGDIPELKTVARTGRTALRLAGFDT